MRRPRSSAQSKVAGALDEVQTMPPLRPQCALMAAVEFMYVMGMMSPSSPSSSCKSSQQSSTSSMRAMSAMEQPAVKLGSMTLW